MFNIPDKDEVLIDSISLGRVYEIIGMTSSQSQLGYDLGLNYLPSTLNKVVFDSITEIDSDFNVNQKIDSLFEMLKDVSSKSIFDNAQENIIELAEENANASISKSRLLKSGGTRVDIYSILEMVDSDLKDSMPRLTIETVQHYCEQFMSAMNREHSLKEKAEKAYKELKKVIWGIRKCEKVGRCKRPFFDLPLSQLPTKQRNFAYECIKSMMVNTRNCRYAWLLEWEGTTYERFNKNDGGDTFTNRYMSQSMIGLEVRPMDTICHLLSADVYPMTSLLSTVGMPLNFSAKKTSEKYNEGSTFERYLFELIEMAISPNTNRDLDEYQRTYKKHIKLYHQIITICQLAIDKKNEHIDLDDMKTLVSMIQDLVASDKSHIQKWYSKYPSFNISSEKITVPVWVERNVGAIFQSNIRNPKGFFKEIIDFFENDRNFGKRLKIIMEDDESKRRFCKPVFSTWHGRRPFAGFGVTEFWNGMQIFDIDIKADDGIKELKERGEVDVVQYIVSELMDRLHASMSRYGFYFMLKRSLSGVGFHMFTKIGSPDIRLYEHQEDGKYHDKSKTHIYPEISPIENELMAKDNYFFKHQLIKREMLSIEIDLSVFGMDNFTFSAESFDVVLDSAMGQLAQGIALTHDEKTLINPRFFEMQLYKSIREYCPIDPSYNGSSDKVLSNYFDEIHPDYLEYYNLISSDEALTISSAKKSKVRKLLRNKIVNVKRTKNDINIDVSELEFKTPTFLRNIKKSICKKLGLGAYQFRFRFVSAFKCIVEAFYGEDLNSLLESKSELRDTFENFIKTALKVGNASDKRKDDDVWDRDDEMYKFLYDPNVIGMPHKTIFPYLRKAGMNFKLGHVKKTAHRKRTVSSSYKIKPISPHGKKFKREVTKIFEIMDSEIKVSETIPDINFNLSHDMFLTHLGGDLVNSFSNDRINILYAGAGVGKNYFTNMLLSGEIYDSYYKKGNEYIPEGVPVVEQKRGLIVVPYLSILSNKYDVDGKVDTDKYELVYGYISMDKVVPEEDDLDNVSVEKNVVCTFDKFSRMSLKQLQKFDYIFVDESHLLFNSSYRMEVVTGALRLLGKVAKSAQSSFSIFNRPVVPTVIMMTGTPIAEQFFFNQFSGGCNFIKVNKDEKRKKDVKFLYVPTKNDANKFVVSVIGDKIHNGYTVIYPSNKGDMEGHALWCAVRSYISKTYGEDLPAEGFSYYKRSNKDLPDVVNVEKKSMIHKDVKLLMCSTYLSVGVDIENRDKTSKGDGKYEFVFNGLDFIAEDVEQFINRIRKNERKATIIAPLCVESTNLNPNDAPKVKFLSELFNSEYRIVKIAKEMVKDAEFFKGIVEGVNAAALHDLILNNVSSGSVNVAKATLGRYMPEKYTYITRDDENGVVYDRASHALSIIVNMHEEIGTQLRYLRHKLSQEYGYTMQERVYSSDEIDKIVGMSHAEIKDSYSIGRREVRDCRLEAMNNFVECFVSMFKSSESRYRFSQISKVEYITTNPLEDRKETDEDYSKYDDGVELDIRPVDGKDGDYELLVYTSACNMSRIEEMTKHLKRIDKAPYSNETFNKIVDLSRNASGDILMSELRRYSALVIWNMSEHNRSDYLVQKYIKKSVENGNFETDKDGNYICSIENDGDVIMEMVYTLKGLISEHLNKTLTSGKRYLNISKQLSKRIKEQMLSTRLFSTDDSSLRLEKKLTELIDIFVKKRKVGGKNPYIKMSMREVPEFDMNVENDEFLLQSYMGLMIVDEYDTDDTSNIDGETKQVISDFEVSNEDKVSVDVHT